MAVYDAPRTTAQAAGQAGFFSNLVGIVSAWNDARITRNALSKLTDRELEDIGLCRGDIDFVVKNR
ncbi:MAG: DUF1127 domain-containing protein [Paracoccaceae bacterium]|jgi:uncharacterized protein YjiS (DUF1127 family)|nr:DUF1127 domain-containing protein [Paracoccaceae bacterium]